jgi:hypothetical protein
VTVTAGALLFDTDTLQQLLLSCYTCLLLVQPPASKWTSHSQQAVDPCLSDTCLPVPAGPLLLDTDTLEQLPLPCYTWPGFMHNMPDIAHDQRQRNSSSSTSLTAAASSSSAGARSKSSIRSRPNAGDLLLQLPITCYSPPDVMHQLPEIACYQRQRSSSSSSDGGGTAGSTPAAVGDNAAAVAAAPVPPAAAAAAPAAEEDSDDDEDWCMGSAAAYNLLGGPPKPKRPAGKQQQQQPDAAAAAAGSVVMGRACTGQDVQELRHARLVASSAGLGSILRSASSSSSSEAGTPAVPPAPAAADDDDDDDEPEWCLGSAAAYSLLGGSPEKPAGSQQQQQQQPELPAASQQQDNAKPTGLHAGSSSSAALSADGAASAAEQPAAAAVRVDVRRLQQRFESLQRVQQQLTETLAAKLAWEVDPAAHAQLAAEAPTLDAMLHQLLADISVATRDFSAELAALQQEKFGPTEQQQQQPGDSQQQQQQLQLLQVLQLHADLSSWVRSNLPIPAALGTAAEASWQEEIEAWRQQQQQLQQIEQQQQLQQIEQQLKLIAADIQEGARGAGGGATGGEDHPHHDVGVQGGVLQLVLDAVRGELRHKGVMLWQWRQRLQEHNTAFQPARVSEEDDWAEASSSSSSEGNDVCAAAVAAAQAAVEADGTVLDATAAGSVLMPLFDAPEAAAAAGAAADAAPVEIGLPAEDSAAAHMLQLLQEQQQLQLSFIDLLLCELQEQGGEGLAAAAAADREQAAQLLKLASGNKAYSTEQLQLLKAWVDPDSLMGLEEDLEEGINFAELQLLAGSSSCSVDDDNSADYDYSCNQEEEEENCGGGGYANDGEAAGGSAKQLLQFINGQAAEATAAAAEAEQAAAAAAAAAAEAAAAHADGAANSGTADGAAAEAASVEDVVPYQPLFQAALYRGKARGAAAAAAAAAAGTGASTGGAASTAADSDAEAAYASVYQTSFPAAYLDAFDATDADAAPADESVGDAASVLPSSFSSSSSSEASGVVSTADAADAAVAGSSNSSSSSSSSSSVGDGSSSAASSNSSSSSELLDELRTILRLQVRLMHPAAAAAAHSLAPWIVQAAFRCTTGALVLLRAVVLGHDFQQQCSSGARTTVQLLWAGGVHACNMSQQSMHWAPAAFEAPPPPVFVPVGLRAVCLVPSRQRTIQLECTT